MLNSNFKLSFYNNNWDTDKGFQFQFDKIWEIWLARGTQKILNLPFQNKE